MVWVRPGPLYFSGKGEAGGNCELRKEFLRGRRDGIESVGMFRVLEKKSGGGGWVGGLEGKGGKSDL